MNDSEKLQKATNSLQKWVNKQGHDKCWYYPDIFLELCQIFDIEPHSHPNLPSPEDFNKGCLRYQKEIYAERSWKPPVKNCTHQFSNRYQYSNMWVCCDCYRYFWGEKEKTPDMDIYGRPTYNV